MQILLMRHGQAEPFNHTFHRRDANRQLTESGQTEAQVMALWLKRQQIMLDQIFVSPYLRALQTAERVTQELASNLECQVLDILTPAGNAKDFQDYLIGVNIIRPLSTILVVSHMPLVSYLVAQFTQQQDTPIFQTAAIAKIQYNEQTLLGQLDSIVAPSDLG